MKTAHVISVNDYPFEVSFLDEEGTQERVAEIQERLNAEDGVNGEKGIQRFVRYRSCPVVKEAPPAFEQGDLVIWRSSTYYGDSRPDELAVVSAVVSLDPSKYEVRIMSIHDFEEYWVKRENVRQAKQLAWIIRYVIAEGFGEEHLGALAKIVGLFNDCEESERAILEFANRLFERYAGY